MEESNETRKPNENQHTNLITPPHSKTKKEKLSKNPHLNHPTSEEGDPLTHRKMDDLDNDG